MGGIRFTTSPLSPSLSRWLMSLAGTSTIVSLSARVHALQRGEVKHVAVLSLWHFAHLPGVQDAMRQHIQQETGACILVVQGQRR